MARLSSRVICLLVCLAVGLVAVAFAGDEPAAHVPAVGDTAPAFNANTDAGDLWQSIDHVGKGKYLVVYFYPAAMTGGCTQQACSYRDQIADLSGLDAEVIAVSADPVNNLKLFKQAHNLDFVLLSDVNGAIARRFGVPVRVGGTFQMTVDGKDVMLKRPYTLARWTFIVGKDGKIVRKDTDVNASGDSRNVIDWLQAVGQ
jgi:peroxiredoxin Q/BCP